MKSKQEFIYELYDHRGDLRDAQYEAALREKETPMLDKLYRAVDEQIRLIESITPEAQAAYFAEVTETYSTGIERDGAETGISQPEIY